MYTMSHQIFTKEIYFITSLFPQKNLWGQNFILKFCLEDLDRIEWDTKKDGREKCCLKPSKLVPRNYSPHYSPIRRRGSESLKVNGSLHTPLPLGVSHKFLNTQSCILNYSSLAFICLLSLKGLFPTAVGSS